MDGKLATTTYSYDVRGNRTRVLASNSSGPQSTTYTFDLANRLLTETNPLNQVTTFTYDARGSRETKVDGKLATTTYTYDDARRLTVSRLGPADRVWFGQTDPRSGPVGMRLFAHVDVGALARPN